MLNAVFVSSSLIATAGGQKFTTFTVEVGERGIGENITDPSSMFVRNVIQWQFKFRVPAAS
jgi:hypothetical protein